MIRRRTGPLGVERSTRLAGLSEKAVVACDNVRDCVFLKDDLNRVKKGFNSYELNFSLPTNSQNKLTELN